MREIKYKYRAINKLNPIGVESKHTYFTLEDLMRGKFVFVYPEHWYFTRYTGLKDKNGKEIYEGDVVRIAGYGNYEVEWPFGGLLDALFEGDIEEIIGNIYENPELLK